MVNGGQITASVHRSMREKVYVSRIAVQAKITVVDGPLLEEFVPDISRYANTQTRSSRPTSPRILDEATELGWTLQPTPLAERHASCLR